MAAPKTYVRTDSDGVMRAGAAGVLFDGVIAAFELGDSPQSICRQYPRLTLEEVFGAIAYYLANRKEVEEYFERQEAVWAKWRAHFEKDPAPVVERLRALRASRQSSHSIWDAVGKAQHPRSGNDILRDLEADRNSSDE